VLGADKASSLRSDAAWRRFGPCRHLRSARTWQLCDGRRDARLLRPANSAIAARLENQDAAVVALYFLYYSFAGVHQTLRVTPAIEAGIATRVGSVDAIVQLLGAK